MPTDTAIGILDTGHSEISTQGQIRRFAKGRSTSDWAMLLSRISMVDLPLYTVNVMTL